MLCINSLLSLLVYYIKLTELIKWNVELLSMWYHK